MGLVANCLHIPIFVLSNIKLIKQELWNPLYTFKIAILTIHRNTAIMPIFLYRNILQKECKLQGMMMGLVTDGLNIQLHSHTEHSCSPAFP